MSRGGDSSGIDFSGGVKKIVSTFGSFAALKNDGSVVTWGDSYTGADSSGVDFSGGVKDIFSNSSAFAAIKNDGSVVTWGASSYGGDSSSVSKKLSSNVRQIISTEVKFWAPGSGFFAVKAGGEVVVWGDILPKIKDERLIQNYLSGLVKKVVYVDGSFTVIKKDNSALVLGSYEPTFYPDLRSAE